MAPNYSPLTINATLESSLRKIQRAEVQDDAARKTLGLLLQSALQLEFATVSYTHLTLPTNREV